jgi:predicted neutral ceramidase superfamily lipid hydrolase
MAQKRSSKLDRELIELLNELRVVLPGVQVLFAFLLIVPFSQPFGRVTGVERGMYFTAFVCAAIASAFLIAPSAYHRLRWREHDKERMLILSNRLAVAGTTFLAAAITCTVYVVASFVYDNVLADVATGIIAGLIVLLWYGLPVYGKAADARRSS